MSELQVKYGERCKTESANSAILEVYEFILQHEESDTDCWALNTSFRQDKMKKDK
ncbi:hypothetical protein GCM10009118_32070 [Wandonia haliotis]|uniref:Uncharacterized protein n=1 Tax=Wandonia haliotis TaxID=574963 RepID=A0ABP3YAX9_9FLAO